MDRISSPEKIDFVLTGNVEGLIFQPAKPGGLAFVVDDGRKLRITIRPRKDDEIGFGRFSSLEFSVFSTYEVSPDEATFAAAYGKRQYFSFGTDGVEIPHLDDADDLPLIYDDGAWRDGYSPSLNACPAEIRGLILLVEKELGADLRRFIRLLRWRQDFEGPPDPVTSASLYWRVGDGKYPHAPQPLQEYFGPTPTGINWDAQAEDDLRAMWAQSDLQEPLAHELLREAVALEESSPRSAILMAAAALEAGAKVHISQISPDTAWLVEKMPSPPMFKLLQEYIPALHRERGTDVDWWPKLITSVKNAQNLFEARNKIAHTGRIPTSAMMPSEYTNVVKDILYALDVLAGHEWAKQRLSFHIRRELGWPDPPEHRGYARLTAGRL
jgi:hypothetical protein